MSAPDNPQTTPPATQASPSPAAKAGLFHTGTERGRFHIETFVALATLVLTPLLSAGVVSYQLSREHSFVVTSPGRSFPH